MKQWFKSEPHITPDEKKVKSTTFWHIALLGFIVIWLVGAFIFLERKASIGSHQSPEVILVGESGNISPKNLTNFFSIKGTSVDSFSSRSNTGEDVLYEVRADYEIGDVLIVKYFYVEVVVVDKSLPGGGTYTVMYKDHEHVLQKITLPREFLMFPVGKNVLNPVSLLVD